MTSLKTPLSVCLTFVTSCFFFITSWTLQLMYYHELVAHVLNVIF